MSERTLMDVLTEAHDRHAGVSRMLISDLCKPARLPQAPLPHGEEFGPAWEEENRLDIIRARELTVLARKEKP